MRISLLQKSLVAMLAIPAPALADGLGGLAAARALGMFALGLFVALWLIVWMLLRWWAKHRNPSTNLVYWMRNTEIPVGLRCLAVIQYVLAFFYAMDAVLTALFPTHFHNGHIAERVLYTIFFQVLFSALAVISANGYIKRLQRQGFQLGVVLGWICCINFLVYLGFFGRYQELDLMTPIYGLVLLVLLNWRYRCWFGCEQRSDFYLKAKRLGRWVGLRASVFVLVFLSGSLLVTTVLPNNLENARQVLKNVATAVEAYRTTHGKWPQSLEQLEPSVHARYRWYPVQYTRNPAELVLKATFVESPDLSKRLSFGLFGYSQQEISQIGLKLGNL